jgi:hypothetical protein
MRSWPTKYRLLSFVITIGVTLAEFALVAVPIGLVLWLFDFATVEPILVTASILAGTFSLSISLYVHVWPRRYRVSASAGGVR